LLVDAMLARSAGCRNRGSPWGSALERTCSRTPAKVAAYVGVGQISNMAQSEAESYAFALTQPRRAVTERHLRPCGRWAAAAAGSRAHASAALADARRVRGGFSLPKMLECAGRRRPTSCG
jgi:hypothetical protein